MSGFAVRRRDDSDRPGSVFGGKPWDLRGLEKPVRRQNRRSEPLAAGLFSRMTGGGTPDGGGGGLRMGIRGGPGQVRHKGAPQRFFSGATRPGLRGGPHRLRARPAVFVGN